MTETILWERLSQKEKNILIHTHVMGRVLQENCDGGIGELPNSPDGWFCLRCGYSSGWGDDFHHTEVPPSYVTDMNFAWQVLRIVCEKKDRQYPWHIFSQVELTPEAETFYQTLVELTGNLYDSSTYPAYAALTHITQWTPDFICRAALIVCGYDVKEKSV